MFICCSGLRATEYAWYNTRRIWHEAQRKVKRVNSQNAEGQQAVLEAIASVRCGVSVSELQIHALIEHALMQAGIDVKHEVRIAPRCRIYFVAGRIGIEIKKNRPERAKLIAQLSRYAACEQIDELIVVMSRGIDLPRTIGGKRITVIALERLWGIWLP